MEGFVTFIIIKGAYYCISGPKWITYSSGEDQGFGYCCAEFKSHRGCLVVKFDHKDELFNSISCWKRRLLVSLLTSQAISSFLLLLWYLLSVSYFRTQLKECPSLTEKTCHLVVIVMLDAECCFLVLQGTVCRIYFASINFVGYHRKCSWRQLPRWYRHRWLVHDVILSKLQRSTANCTSSNNDNTNSPSLSWISI